MQTRMILSPADHGRMLSWDEFSIASGNEGYHYELIEGRLVVSPLPAMAHEFLRKWLERQLDCYAVARPDIINYVQAPARVFVPEPSEGISAPEPDIACYADFPLPPSLDEIDWNDFSPVLVAEVLSADTEDKDLVRNRRLYLQVPAIREYWILDPRESFDRPSLIVFRRRGQRWAPAVAVAAGDTYTTRLLPGFTLRLDPHANG